MGCFRLSREDKLVKVRDISNNRPGSRRTFIEQHHSLWLPVPDLICISIGDITSLGTDIAIPGSNRVIIDPGNTRLTGRIHTTEDHFDLDIIYTVPDKRLVQFEQVITFFRHIAAVIIDDMTIAEILVMAADIRIGRMLHLQLEIGNCCLGSGFDIVTEIGDYTRASMA